LDQIIPHEVVKRTVEDLGSTTFVILAHVLMQRCLSKSYFSELKNPNRD